MDKVIWQFLNMLLKVLLTSEVEVMDGRALMTDARL